MGLWDFFGAVYDNMRDAVQKEIEWENEEEKNREEQLRREEELRKEQQEEQRRRKEAEEEYYGSWYSRRKCVGGPIRIEYANGRTTLRCYSPDAVYYGAEVIIEYVDGPVLQAYWSGNVLFANLPGGRICEWRAPGCPFIR